MNQSPVAPPTVRDYLRILGRRWWVVVLGCVGWSRWRLLLNIRHNGNLE